MIISTCNISPLLAGMVLLHRDACANETKEFQPALCTVEFLLYFDHVFIGHSVCVECFVNCTQNCN